MKVGVVKVWNEVKGWGFIIGNDGESKITAWDLANLIGTIPYEVLTSIGSRVERVYLS